MDFFSSMRVGASALNAQMKRMNVIQSNISNAETVGYKRKDPVMHAVTDRESFGEILQNEMDENVQGVMMTDVKEDEKPPRLIYKPNHPQANADGYVAYPNVNTVEEMANMISAQRAYEANVSAINAAKSMAKKALEIGR